VGIFKNLNPHCPLDAIEARQREASRARTQNKRKAPMPKNTPFRAPDNVWSAGVIQPPPPDNSQLVENVISRIAQLEAENADLRDVLARYVDQAAQHAAEVEGYRWELKETARTFADLATRFDRLSDDLEQFANAQAERDAELAEVKAIKDRFKAKGKLALAQCKEMEALLKHPDAKKALKKALHRDSHPDASPQQKRAYDQAFTTMNAIYERIEAG
jgi:hypothetical protein